MDLKFANHPGGLISPVGESAADVFYTNSAKLPIKSDVGAFDRIRIENDLQMAVLSLPALELGDNIVRYSDETTAPHVVNVPTSVARCMSAASSTASTSSACCSSVG